MTVADAVRSLDVADPPEKVYTMELDRDYRTKSFITSALQDPVPSLARVTIYPGILIA